MKSLFIKDFFLIKMQKRFLVVIVLLSIVMAVSTRNVSFVMGYLTLIVPLLSLSTISYDEFDNGNAFLFTLPISKKIYVIEKYCFSLVLGTVALVIACIIALIYGIFTDISYSIDAIKTALPVFATMTVILSFMLPLQLKFGAEKSRIVIIVFAGIVFALVFAFSKLAEKFQFNQKITDRIASINPAIIISILITAVLLILLLSVKTSISIMNKKEF